VLGYLQHVEPHVINGRWIEQNAAIGIDDIFLVDDLLDSNNLLELLDLTATERRFVDGTTGQPREHEKYSTEQK
jgi:hypothetical protein